ncbi:sensor histidine kinase [Fulvimarina pelagi]|uniref:histidine kinase n=1 Tax=Fulvimarina pelagi TaxID=217511 RepID=A0A0P0Z9Y3_9HYPH|nr:HAMP domain-containing sensor histidine kinase [Fulvimarina pelagi]BAT31174.1 putative sensor histidine kinase protein [Fulvimarina pelagi]
MASVATPVMAAADMSGAIVAMPLFLAGIAVAAASLLGGSNVTDGTEATSIKLSAAHPTADAALPLADLFGAAAYVVSSAGCIMKGNRAGEVLSDEIGTHAGPPVLFDLLDSASRATAMAALREHTSHPVTVRLKNDETRLLHVLTLDGETNVLTVLRPVAGDAKGANQLAEPEPGRLSEAMLATVSHELRTPLNAIIGFSGILENELFGALNSDKQREYVGLIQSSGRHLLSVVNDILDVSKIEAGAYQLHCEHFLLDEVVEEASAMVRCQADQKGVSIEIACPPGGTTIHGDRRALNHMLVNLLANAVKFTDAGTVTLSWERAGRDLRLNVADTGIGIPADQIGKLGKPFVQASCGMSRRYEGTGLGLAYVRGMCELHGGAMTIESTEGEGTRVMLDMPLVPRQATTIEDKNIVALNHARHSKNTGVTDTPQRRTA